MIANFLLNRIGVTLDYSEIVENLLFDALKEDNAPRGAHITAENQLKLFELPNSRKLLKAYMDAFPDNFSQVFSRDVWKKLFELEDAEELWDLYIKKCSHTCCNEDLENLLLENIRLTPALKSYLKKERVLYFITSEDKFLSRPDAKEIVPYYISLVKEDGEPDEYLNNFIAAAQAKGVI